MRTTKLFTSVITALGLMYSSGCCDTNCAPVERPVAVDCAPVAYVATSSSVTYEPECPPAATVALPPPRAVRVRAQRTNCYSRKRVRYYYATPCDPCGPQYYPAVAYAGTTTVLTNPGYVRTAQVAPATTVVAAPPPRETVTVLQRGRKGRTVAYSNKGNKNNSRRAAAYTAGATTAPAFVLSTPDADSFESESYSFTSLSPAIDEPEEVTEAVAIPEPIEAVEPAEMVEALPEPVIDEPEYAQYIDTSAPAVVAEPVPAVAAPGPMELVPGQILESPMPSGYHAMQPVVIQPIIQPVIAPGPQSMGAQGQVQGAVAAPPAGAWVQGGMVSSAYCPPEICPVPNSALCAPGMNLSECFTLSENQLLNSPQIYTPDASNPLLPLSQSPVAMAPVAQHPAAQLGQADKYAALTPPPDLSRPQVSMPTPLHTDNIPMVPGTAEIESMLDAMVPPPNLK